MISRSSDGNIEALIVVHKANIVTNRMLVYGKDIANKGGGEKVVTLH